MVAMRRYKRESAPLISRFEEIYTLMRDVYEKTGGKYPALEWVHKKPVPGEKEWKDRFREIYAPFLRWRLENEIDEIITVEDPEIIGIIGINYVHNPEVFEGYRRIFREIGMELHENSAFLEILAVHPSRWRKGLGRLLLESAIDRVKDTGRKAYGITFPDLYPALHLYELLEAEVLGKVEGFSWNEGDRGADYLILRFR